MFAETRKFAEAPCLVFVRCDNFQVWKILTKERDDRDWFTVCIGKERSEVYSAVVFRQPNDVAVFRDMRPQNSVANVDGIVRRDGPDFKRYERVVLTCNTTFTAVIASFS